MQRTKHNVWHINLFLLLINWSISWLIYLSLHSLRVFGSSDFFQIVEKFYFFWFKVTFQKLSLIFWFCLALALVSPCKNSEYCFHCWHNLDETIDTNDTLALTFHVTQQDFNYIQHKCEHKHEIFVYIKKWIWSSTMRITRCEMHHYLSP